MHPFWPVLNQEEQGTHPILKELKANCPQVLVAHCNQGAEVQYCGRKSSAYLLVTEPGCIEYTGNIFYNP